MKTQTQTGLELNNNQQEETLMENKLNLNALEVASLMTTHTTIYEKDNDSKHPLRFATPSDCVNHARMIMMQVLTGRITTPDSGEISYNDYLNVRVRVKYNNVNLFYGRELVVSYTIKTRKEGNYYKLASIKTNVWHTEKNLLIDDLFAFAQRKLSEQDFNSYQAFVATYGRLVNAIENKRFLEAKRIYSEISYKYQDTCNEWLQKGGLA